MESPTPYVVNEAVDTLANQLQSVEEQAKKEWIDNHAVIDDFVISNSCCSSFHK